MPSLRSREMAEKEIEIFLRAGARALGRSEDSVLRISDGFEIQNEDVSCVWVENGPKGTPIWRVAYYYSQINLLTDEATFVGPVTVQEYPVGEEYQAAKQVWLTVLSHLLDGVMANVH
jgi:hypothetical protein